MNLETRIAWYDKTVKQCFYGNWSELTTKLSSIQNWVDRQNTVYPMTRYWIEGRIVTKRIKFRENLCNANDCYYIEPIFGNIESFNIDFDDVTNYLKNKK